MPPLFVRDKVTSLVFRPTLRYGGPFLGGGKISENAHKLRCGYVLIALR